MLKEEFRTIGNRLEETVLFIATASKPEEQERQLMEECAELIIACDNYWQRKDTDLDRDGRDELIEEIADVSIMLSQVSVIEDLDIDMKISKRIIENDKYTIRPLLKELAVNNAAIIKAMNKVIRYGTKKKPDLEREMSVFTGLSAALLVKLGVDSDEYTETLGRKLYKNLKRLSYV